MLAYFLAPAQTAIMTNDRGELARSQPPLEVVRIEPGQRIRLETQSGSIYEIDEIREEEGMIHTTITHHAAAQTGEEEPTKTFNDAYIVSWPNDDNPHSLRQIYPGSRLEVIGYDRATHERVDFMTTPVIRISSEPSAE
jgi:hypothetical protein